MKLSPHFSLSELTKSHTAVRLGINNEPGPEEIENLTRLTLSILEPVRREFGLPFTPSSGFRCLELNRAIGSKDTSQHIKGEAVDFEIPTVTNRIVAAWMQSHLKFDQLILEFHEPSDPSSGWIHVSLKARGNRSEVLTINSTGVHKGLLTNRPTKSTNSLL